MSIHCPIANLFHRQRKKTKLPNNLQLQNAAMIAWREITLARGQTQAYCVRRRYRAFVSSGFSSAGISAGARLRIISDFARGRWR